MKNTGFSFIIRLAIQVPFMAFAHLVWHDPSEILRKGNQSPSRKQAIEIDEWT